MDILFLNSDPTPGFKRAVFRKCSLISFYHRHVNHADTHHTQWDARIWVYWVVYLVANMIKWLFTLLLHGCKSCSIKYIGNSCVFQLNAYMITLSATPQQTNDWNLRITLWNGKPSSKPSLWALPGGCVIGNWNPYILFLVSATWAPSPVVNML